jgi:hypothetical protein
VCGCSEHPTSLRLTLSDIPCTCPQLLSVPSGPNCDQTRADPRASLLFDSGWKFLCDRQRGTLSGTARMPFAATRGPANAYATLERTQPTVGMRAITADPILFLIRKQSV